MIDKIAPSRERADTDTVACTSRELAGKPLPNRQGTFAQGRNDLRGRVRQELMDPPNDINGTIDLFATAEERTVCQGHKWTPICDVLVEA